MAVGNGQHWTFNAESIGIATDNEHFPIPDKSLIAATFLHKNPPLVCINYNDTKIFIYIYITIKKRKK